MAEAIELAELKRTKEVMQSVIFFNFSCDEVTLVDFQSWISAHNYVVVIWKCIPILLTLERIVEGGITYYLTLWL